MSDSPNICHILSTIHAHYCPVDLRKERQHQIFFISLLVLLRRLKDQINLCACPCCGIGSLRRIFAKLCPKIVLTLLLRIGLGSLRLLRRHLHTFENCNNLTLSLMRILFVFNHIYQLLILAYMILYFILRLETDTLLHTQMLRKAHLDLLAEGSTCRIKLKVLSKNLLIFVLI